MTNAKALKDIASKKGIKLSFIAEKIGMSPQCFCTKLDRCSDFRAWQLLVISDIMHLTDEEIRTIFFALNVDKIST